MNKAIAFSILSFLLINNTLDKVSVSIKLIEPPTAQRVLIGVQIKNLSVTALKVLKNRRHDYKWERVKSIGNYIIEIEKKENGKFLLFAPSTDINPTFEAEEYVTIKKGETIEDSLDIPGSSFSRNGDFRGFPRGNYRIRVSFNSSEWSSSQVNSSNWINFKIE